MPKIVLNGELHISTELFKCLQARGVLADLAEPENFNFYLQECISRDNIAFLTQRYSEASGISVPYGQNLLPGVTKEPETAIEEPIESSEAVAKVDKEAIADSLAQLYRR